MVQIRPTFARNEGLVHPFLPMVTPLVAPGEASTEYGRTGGYWWCGAITIAMSRTTDSEIAFRGAEYNSSSRGCIRKSKRFSRSRSCRFDSITDSNGMSSGRFGRMRE